MRTAHSLVAIALLLLSQTAAAAFVVCLEDGGSEVVIEAIAATCCSSEEPSPVPSATHVEAHSVLDRGAENCGCQDVPLSVIVLMIASKETPSQAEAPPAKAFDLSIEEDGATANASQGRYSVAKRLAIRALPPAYWQTPAAAVLLA